MEVLKGDRPGYRQGRGRLRHRPLGDGEVHLSEMPELPRGTRGGDDHLRRQQGLRLLPVREGARVRAPLPQLHGLPELFPVRQPDGGGERRAAPSKGKEVEGRQGGGAGRGASGDDGTGGQAGQLPAPVVGRTAAARRDSPCDGDSELTKDIEPTEQEMIQMSHLLSQDVPYWSEEFL